MAKVHAVNTGVKIPGIKKERAAVTAPQTPENSRYGFEKPTESSLLVCGGKDILNQN